MCIKYLSIDYILLDSELLVFGHVEETNEVMVVHEVIIVRLNYIVREEI